MPTPDARQAAAKPAKLGDWATRGPLIVKRRSVTWLENSVRWRWLMDSYEGGDRYRNAVYGPDRRGLPARNLFRHKREYPDPQQFPTMYQGFAGFLGAVDSNMQEVGYGPYPGMLGADPAATAQDDDYELRRSRTPVPEFTSDAVDLHLSKIYDQEVGRQGPDELIEWWKDVDGRGTPMDDYMRETIAPLLLVCGVIDVCLDHPSLPAGVNESAVANKAVQLEMGLDRCVASYILPENMVWWRVDASGRYTECLVREYVDPADHADSKMMTDQAGIGKGADGKKKGQDTGDEAGVDEVWRKDYIRYRFWTDQESVLLNHDGSEVFERKRHRFGRVPIVRLVDRPRHRDIMAGNSRYHGIAEIQREFYNRSSELILSDTLQAHPFLSGPEEYCKSDNTVSVGPGYILPMKLNVVTNTYQSWEFVSPPKDPANSLRLNLGDLMDQFDRAACILKPAGVTGTTGTSVAQSGISKQFDAHNGNKKIRAICNTLAKAERTLAEYALLCCVDRDPTDEEKAEIAVTYPARFELYSAQELALGIQGLQQMVAGMGLLPNIEASLIQDYIKILKVGMSDEQYQEYDKEIEITAEAMRKVADTRVKLAAGGVTSRADALGGKGSTEQAAGTDPSGQSGATLVSNMIPTVM